MRLLYCLETAGGFFLLNVSLEEKQGCNEIPSNQAFEGVKLYNSKLFQYFRFKFFDVKFFIFEHVIP